MKISSFVIENFRGIQRVEAINLENMVIIAGQNGSGKSCIFDAIRFLKSSYGGYHESEYNQYFGELTITYQGDSVALKPLFNDKSKPIVIEIDFKFTEEEKNFFRQNAEALLRKTAIQRMFPTAQMMGPSHNTAFSANFRARGNELNNIVGSSLQELQNELLLETSRGSLSIEPGGGIKITNSRVLEVAFSHYKPSEIGIIDYHSAQRHFARENISSNISLNYEQSAQASQTALYNNQSKYANVKSNMAAMYVKELIAQKANPAIELRSSINNALKELFKAFFPDKVFLGPVASEDGTLSFPVRTANGSIHDLDDLSSGEKEIVYGYLRMRSSAPKNSIILLDEPELHLNPRLVNSLPAFYNKYLGEDLGNQIWLVTHSDALMRSAVDEERFGLYHMSQSLNVGSNSQLNELFVADVDLLLSELVGDLAAYRPGAKAILFEGGGDSDFDRTMCQKLFPEELKGINLVSATDKTKVKQLHEILVRARNSNPNETKYFAIVDRDLESVVEEGPLTSISWSVYHIENFLLDPKYIASVLNSVFLDNRRTPESVFADLRTAAQGIVGKVVDIEMKSYINKLIVKELSFEHAPAATGIADLLHTATARSLDRINSTFINELGLQSLREHEAELRAKYESAFEDGSWIKILPGRDILKAFVQSSSVGFKYVQFRNLIISAMASENYKPSEMLEKFTFIKNENS